MGLSGSSKTTTSTVKPVYESQILGAYNNVNNAFNRNSGNVQNVQDQLSGLLGTAIGNYNNNSTLNAAKNYVTSTLGSTYGSSPYLDDMVSLTNRNVANATTNALGTRGLTGGSAMAKILAGKLADNETQLRYNDYNNWQDRQAQAASMAPGLSSADATNLSSLLELADQSTSMVTDDALKQASAVAGLLGQYTNGKQTEKSSGSLLSQIGQIAQIASIAASDIRLKDNIRHVGATNEGLPIYTYTYKGDNRLQMGVMAQDVARMQPDALGPVIEGFGTVNYAEVR